MVVLGSACEAASWTSRSGTPASSAAVMNACRSVMGRPGLWLPGGDEAVGAGDFERDAAWLAEAGLGQPLLVFGGGVVASLVFDEHGRPGGVAADHRLVRGPQEAVGGPSADLGAVG